MKFDSYELLRLNTPESTAVWLELHRRRAEESARRRAAMAETAADADTSDRAAS